MPLSILLVELLKRHIKHIYFMYDMGNVLAQPSDNTIGNPPCNNRFTVQSNDKIVKDWCLDKDDVAPQRYYRPPHTHNKVVAQPNPKEIAQPKKEVVAQPCNRINTLPDNIVNTILMFLPTRDAIRTSILSRKWRYRWTKLPQLILDETLWDKSIIRYSTRFTVAMILYQILLLHEGPIKKLVLSIPGLESCFEIDNLVFFLSRNGIEELKIEILTYEHYKLPLSIYTCQQLRRLTLWNCSLDGTFDFKGFSSLIALTLGEVKFKGKVLGHLISGSPVLELLEIYNSLNLLDLEIDALNLRTFNFKGAMKSLIFRRVPRLSSVSIYPYDSADNDNYFNFVKFSCGLPRLEDVDLRFTLAKSLGIGGFPTTLAHLKHLNLSEITLHEPDELRFILCVLRNSSNLKRLAIQISVQVSYYTFACLGNLKEEDESEVKFNELKEVKLQNIMGTIVEMNFIKLLLAKSPTLEKMMIEPAKEIANKGGNILKQLNTFRRASTKAEVIYEDDLTEVQV